MSTDAGFDDHARVRAAIASRAAVERDRFEQAGLGGLPEDLSALRQAPDWPPPYGELARALGRKLRAAVARVVRPERHRARRAKRTLGDPSYSRDDEMASDLARRPLLFHLDGRLALATRLAHHLRNMDVVAGAVHRWGAISILEAGVGTGANLLLLRGLLGQEAGLSGFDRALPRVMAARGLDGAFGLRVEPLLAGDVLAIPFRDRSRDVVFSNYVVTYLRGNEDRALDEMLRVARLGVVLFETSSFRAGPIERSYLSQTGQSRRLVQAVRARRDVVVEALERRRGDRYVGVPTVAAVLRKR